ncbi:MAG: hypothetical protein ABIO05_04715 [Ferruginibacter sp.]
MKTIFIIFSLLSLHPDVNAQSKQKAEKEFLKELNEIIKESPNQHWEFNGKMSVDSPFTITPSGHLSVTVKYITDTATVWVRSEAPVNKITFAKEDVYTYLEFRDKSVMVYEKSKGKDWSIRFKRNMFHIGVADDDGKDTGKVIAAFNKLRKFYPTAYLD